MTNREESEAAEHETYPGPGPLRADEGKRGIHPVEQMVDAAIDRIAREREASRTEDRNPGHALALAPKALAPDGAPSALATTRRGNGKLRWKGLEVSDEFRSYAERVARGEDLPPYKGRILAEPDAAFPWEPAARKRAVRHARRLQTVLWGVGAALVGVASWSLVVQLGGEADAWQRAGESALSTAAFSSTVLSSQPNTVHSGSAEAPAELAPPTITASPLQVNEPVEPSSAGPAGSTALAGLSAPNRAPANPPAALPTERSQPVSEPTKAIAPPGSVGVFVATRAQSNEVVSGPAIPVTSSAAAAPASPSAAVAALGASDPPSASSSTITPSEGAIAQADPKKEPTVEASGMGALLVETPSF